MQAAEAIQPRRHLSLIRVAGERPPSRSVTEATTTTVIESRKAQGHVLVTDCNALVGYTTIILNRVSINRPICICTAPEINSIGREISVINIIFIMSTYDASG